MTACTSITNRPWSIRNCWRSFATAKFDRAMAAEAVRESESRLAARGLNSTVTQDYYAIVSAQRKFANAQTSLREADQFLDITQKQEKGGEVAHADVIKAQITQQQRQRDLQDAHLNIEKAKIALGVLIFPDFRSDFAVEDDLAAAHAASPVPRSAAPKPRPQVPISRRRRPASSKPDTTSTLPATHTCHRSALDFFYGIDANQFAATAPPTSTILAAARLPQYTVPNRQNLGYSAQVTLNIPVWNWGATRSKIKQAALKQQQAELDLTLAQRTLQGNVAVHLYEKRRRRRRKWILCAVRPIFRRKACG